MKKIFTAKGKNEIITQTILTDDELIIVTNVSIYTEKRKNNKKEK